MTGLLTSETAARWSTVADIYDEAHDWKWRTVRASIGTTTGAILIAILGARPKRGPAFGRHCNITMHGNVLTDVRGPDGKWIWQQRIGTVEAVRDNLRRLADHCKLNDRDREALFDELRKWIKRDDRAIAGLTPGER